MPVAIQANSGRDSRGGSAGIGTQAQPNGLGWVGMAGKAGDQIVIPLQDLTTSDINQGIFFQSSAAATLEFTLINVATAVTRDPDLKTSVLWTTPLVLVAKAITPCSLLFTAVRITFTAAGELYIGVR